MKDQGKTRGQLLTEIALLRQRVAELERELAAHKGRTEPAKGSAASRVSEARDAGADDESGCSRNEGAGLLSAQRATDEILQEAETKFRMLVEKMPDAIAYIHALDELNTLLYASPQVEKMLGYTARELQQTPGGWWEGIHPDDRERVLAAFKRCRESGEQFSAEYRVIKKDGEVVWLHDVADMLRDETGTLISILGVAYDVSPRKRFEEALQASEARYQNIFENATQGIFQTTPDGRYLSMNPAFARMFGYPSQEAMMAAISDIAAQIYVHPEDRDRVKKLLTEKGRVEKFEIQSYRCDGEIIWISSNARVVRDTTGAILYYEGTAEDITERKRAELALQESQQQLADILALLPDATLVIDRDGKVIAWNLAMEEMTGVSKEDMLGKSKEVCAALLHGHPRPMLVDAVLDDDLSVVDIHDHVARKGNTLYAERYVSQIHGGKGGYVWSIASPLFDRQGKVIGGIESIRDITERKKMEATLREREKELEAKSLDLEEINTALRVLLKRREEDQKEFGASVLSNLKELVFPYLDKLRDSALSELQRTYLGVVTSHLQEIGAPFVRQLSHEFANLSRTERQIAGLIKEGKRNKEMAEILGISVNTVMTHRYHLRTKLGLKNEKINLISFLRSISTL